MSVAPRFIAGLVAGCLTAVAIALVATGLARHMWPAYAAAEPHKTCSFVMLVARLAVGAVCTAGGAGIASMIARDNGRTASWTGALFLAISLPDHLYRVWADYPLWYHVVFLSYLVPIAAVTGRVLFRQVDRNT